MIKDKLARAKYYHNLSEGIKIGFEWLESQDLKNLPDGKQEAHIFIVTNEHPMDIYEARDLCASYKLDSAMAFDGGSSTSFNYKKINVVSTEDNGGTGRGLKSFMIIKKK